MKKLSNSEVARILNEIAEMLQMRGGRNRFRPVAYQRAARSVELLPTSIYRVYKKGGLKAIDGIPGIGESISKKIEELIKTGKLGYYESLKKKIPMESRLLLKIPGLGPKKLKKLNKNLGIKSVSDLKKAARAHKISQLSGFGEKSERDILEGLGLTKSRERVLLAEAKREARRVVGRLAIPEVKRIEIAGSLRRKKPTIGDIDIIVSSSNPEKVVSRFTKMKGVKRVLAKGSEKATVILNSGMQVDLRIFKPESWGAGLLYFTGSKDYNIKIRKIAIKKGYKLSEYGLFDKKSGKMVAGKSEKEILENLGLKYLPPEKRV